MARARGAAGRRFALYDLHLTLEWEAPGADVTSKVGAAWRAGACAAWRCRPRTPLPCSQHAALPSHASLQIKGQISVEDFASTNEPDEYVYSVSVDGSGQLHVSRGVGRAGLPHPSWSVIASSRRGQGPGQSCFRASAQPALRLACCDPQDQCKSRALGMKALVLERLAMFVAELHDFL